ncbi:metal-binding protein [Neosynechococcus sphagnicola]|uniref:metal-binding protein n=1 Tax=Neosynechococcus sphagnicola TaxID=1501145 RepID=UPI00068C340E|nr:metal-binding protein [Neosynechococcus sphagnicola]
MPAGRTHDRITLWSLPLVAGLSLTLTGKSDLTLLVSGSYLFSGLMFGPDLDILSRQYQRWGWLRWIWIPYRKLLRHRSWFSHGPIIGTTLRICYIACWMAGLAFVVLGLAIAISATLTTGQGFNFKPIQDLTTQGQNYLHQHQMEVIALFIGLELGAMSHAVSDWLGSTWKRLKFKP